MVRYGAGLCRKISPTCSDGGGIECQIKCVWPRLFWSSISGVYYTESGQEDAFHALMGVLSNRLAQHTGKLPRLLHSDQLCGTKPSPTGAPMCKVPCDPGEHGPLE
jgi:hypothetical protein